MAKPKRARLEIEHLETRNALSSVNHVLSVVAQGTVLSLNFDTPRQAQGDPQNSGSFVQDQIHENQGNGQPGDYNSTFFHTPGGAAG
jgi:hypothetical protein